MARLSDSKGVLAQAAGFTLIEVLVAMAIIAVTLAAASRSAGYAIENSAELKRRLMADIIAENRLELHSARHDWLPVGKLTGEETQAGIRLDWNEEISNTANPAFRKVVVEVYSKDEPNYIIRKLVGFLVLPVESQ
jgi:general secretion pathway protein I